MKRRSNGQGGIIRRSEGGPWIARWYGVDGRRREASTRTTCKATAQRILARRVADEALRKAGVIDARQDRLAAEGRVPLDDHIEAYVQHCRHAGQDARHVVQKDRHLRALVAGSSAARLTDLTADALERHLGTMRDGGLSARSINFARQIAVAFMSWAVRTGRVDSNALRVVPKLDELKDRRRVRRPLTDDELARLLAVAEDRGRAAWYLAAALAGLRKGDLLRLTWADVDLDAGTITVRGGKARRVDVIPLHPQLAEALRERREASMTLPTARVFPEAVTDLTRLKDFRRSGLARDVVVTDAAGEPVMIGTGKRRRPKTRIACVDDEGRVIDLHALRTTLGTALARAGVAPQIAQRIMRHGDYRTTLRHYTVLGLTDTAGAVEALPSIGAAPATTAAATGTDGTTDPHLYPHLRERDLVRSGANARDDAEARGDSSAQQKPRVHAGLCAPARRLASKRAKGLEPSTFSLEG